MQADAVITADTLLQSISIYTVVESAKCNGSSIPSIANMLSNTIISLLALLGKSFSSPLAERWLSLPRTPDLPCPINTTLTPINGVQLWSQSYNASAGGIPVVLIAGGLGYSAYFGDVISQLSKSHHVSD